MLPAKFAIAAHRISIKENTKFIGSGDRKPGHKKVRCKKPQTQKIQHHPSYNQIPHWRHTNRHMHIRHNSRAGAIPSSATVP